MKTLLLIIFSAVVINHNLFATDYIITISGFTYTPNSISVISGDKVTIEASTFHPLVQVDKATWETNGNTPMNNGWGTKTSSFDFIAATSDTIYFVCSVHHATGMKGRIIVQGLIDIKINKYETDLINLFPNPASTSTILCINSEPNTFVTINLFDSNGKLCKDYYSEINVTGNYKKTLNFEDLNNGIYFLLINENRNEYYKKIIVNK